MADFSIFSQRIKQLRLKMNMTQKEFANSIGTTSVTISAYENNTKKPSLDIIKEIAEKFDISMDWICGLSETSVTENRFATYADIIKIIIKLTTIKNLTVELGTSHSMYATYDDYTPMDYVDPNPYLGLIRFDDSVITTFISEWTDMIKLKEKGTIKPDLYELWLNDKISSLNIPIDSKNQLTQAEISFEEPPTTE